MLDVSSLANLILEDNAMSTSPPIPRLKRMVEYILDENPKYRGIQARNSDIALTIIIWQRWYNVGTNEDSVVHLYRLFDLPREDNVKRVRAVFQNTEHKYLPTDVNVLIKRGIEQEYWEDALGYKLSPEEWKRYHENVKMARNPADVDRHVKAELASRPAPIIENAPMPTMIQNAIYRGRKGYGAVEYQLNQQYELVLEKLQIGKPVKILAPHIREYRDIAAFQKDWKAV